LLDLGDCFGDFNTPRARLGAVEGGAAAPHAFFVVQNVQANLGTLITGVKNEPVGVHDGCGAKVLAIGPEHGAAGGAGSTQDAFSGVVKACPVFGGLQAFFIRLRRRNEEGLNLAVGLEERLHVDNEVFF
jgi:hypothetical protein